MSAILPARSARFEVFMTIKFLDVHAQYLTIRAEIDAAMAAVIADTAFVGGKYARVFEEEFAAYQGAQFCVGVGNGTDALEIALEALALPPGSEIIVPANSFIATSEAVTRSGHRVVFCDCEPGNYTLSVNDAERRITHATRAIIPVHLYGRPCPMDAVMDLARRHNLRVIEDCAQAHGADFGGKRVGTFGDAGTFSFYPGKNLGAYGDAGAIVANNETLATRCRMIANHGRIGKYNHEFEGRNSRMDGLQAAILSVKLRHLESWLARRNEVAEQYRAGLTNCSAIELPAIVPVGMRHVYHLFVIRMHERDHLQEYLKEQGVETGIHYPIALPKLPAYAYLGQAVESLHANCMDGELLSLPIGEHMTDGDVQCVIDVVNMYYA
jgi:dTDP-4-amino-4,6-dideoxygalactose transaminase